MLAITGLVKNNCGKDFFFCYDTASCVCPSGTQFPDQEGRKWRKLLTNSCVAAVLHCAIQRFRFVYFACNDP